MTTSWSSRNSKTVTKVLFPFRYFFLNNINFHCVQAAKNNVNLGRMSYKMTTLCNNNETTFPYLTMNAISTCIRLNVYLLNRITVQLE